MKSVSLGSLQRRWMMVALVVAVLALAAAMSVWLPPGIDWHDTYRPAARELLAARNPYQVEGFYYPLWTLAPMLPLALLPENVGRAMYLLASLAGFGLAAYRMGARPLALAAFLISPPVLHCLLNANVDWMPLLGFVLPPYLGVFLIVVKPQMGFTLGLFWLVEAWRKGGIKQVLYVFGPAALCLLASFAVFGLWPLRFGRTLGFWWNASLWPMSIPVGLALMVAAFRRWRAEYAMAAAPCLSPYVLFHSWSGALIAIVSSEGETLAAVAGLWILVVLRALGGAA